MATIVATVGSASANSYVTLAAAAEYFATRIPSDKWESASGNNTQTRALIQATRRIDRLQFKGWKVTDAQALKWPRIDVFDENQLEYSATTIPQIVQDATCEEAYRILEDTAVDLMANSGLEGFKRVKVGPIEVEPNLGRSNSAIGDYVRRILAHVLTNGSGNVVMATLERF